MSLDNDERKLIEKLDYKENPKIRRILTIIGLVFLIVMTILFRINGGELDLTITGMFYDSSLGAGNEWFMDGVQPWQFFNDNQTAMILITIISGFILLLIGIFDKTRKNLARYGLFVILAVAIGPGLIVNSIFKGYWGRPRPLQTIPFGGTDPFYSVWEPAFLDGMDGASFSSGHPTALLCAIAVFFVFNHPEYIIRYFGEYKEWKLTLCKVIKYTFLIISFVGGFMMGYARVIIGKHFASDVMYSYFFVYAATAILYYWIFNFPKWEKENLKKLKSIQ